MIGLLSASTNVLFIVLNRYGVAKAVPSITPVAIGIFFKNSRLLYLRSCSF